MCRRGFLEKAKDDTLLGDPNIYRLTAVSLGAMGYTTLEAFQLWCRALGTRNETAGEPNGER